MKGGPKSKVKVQRNFTILWPFMREALLHCHFDILEATFFPKARLRVQPSMGDALLWHNTDPGGRVDPRSVHASEPVRSHAVKWVLSKWLRARRFTVDCRGFRQEHW